MIAHGDDQDSWLMMADDGKAQCLFRIDGDFLTTTRIKNMVL
jgi:predicted nucleic acid-binding protein